MKKRIISILAGAALLASCSLGETPYGFYSSENFYQTEADAESGLMYAYNALNYLEYLRAIWYVGDIPTETMYAKSDEPGDIHLLDNWTFTPNTELTWYYFKYCYIALNRANSVLVREKGCDMPAESHNRIRGEALFLRAWSYFNLVRTFGVVPVVTEPVVTVAQTTPKLASGTTEIWDRIFADLKEADSLLVVNKVFGRADKVAAEALLAKAYLTVASGKHYNAPGYRALSYDPDVYYGYAADYARKVVNDYPAYYSLDPDLRHIYDVEAPDGPEHIFIMATDRSGTHEGMYTKIPLQFLPNNSAVPIYIKYGDNSLQKANGNGWGVFIVEDDFVSTFATTDKRRTELIHRQFYDQYGAAITIASGAKYYSAKYVDPDFIGERTSARPYLLRYSDIALVLAESAGPGEGYPLVNAIRARAGLPDLAPGLGLEDFRTEVIKERKWELAFEGNRLFDLRRTGTVTSTVKEAQKISEDAAAFYPIPQREIDLNPNVEHEYNNN
ncbi:MAG: RagB/SusD family nutrient uptake outer membrane protein [Bacteroidales bacterium]|nr:RagB/SusD family nutrient uptake outer membrane protein [Bacteroidales bacterium]